MKFSRLFFFVIISIGGYAQTYRPPDLKKLSYAERLEFIANNISTTHATYKDSLGMPIQNAGTLDPTEISFDCYVNAKNEIIECVSRKTNEQDRLFRRQVIDYFQERAWGVITPIKPDCSTSASVLREILIKDQSNRKKIDLKIDKANLEVVVGILENCGTPTKEQVGKEGMSAIFLVLQHSTRKMQEKYFSLIMTSAKNGDLSLQEAALFEDRHLMENGEKQKYGSQVIIEADGKKKLHPINDPKHVNERRKSMGMEPIEDYLKQWNLEFKVD